MRFVRLTGVDEEGERGELHVAVQHIHAIYPETNYQLWPDAVEDGLTVISMAGEDFFHVEESIPVVLQRINEVGGYRG